MPAVAFVMAGFFMNGVISVKLLVNVVILLALVGCEQERSRQIDSGKLVVKQLDDLRVEDVLQLERVLTLDSSEQGLLGTIGRVRVDDGSGDVCVGDFRSLLGVVRYDSNGEFLARYGAVGDGPGEYRDIVDFAILPDESIVVMSYQKLIKYSPDGRLVDEEDLFFLPDGMLTTDTDLFIRVGRPRDLEVGAIAMFDHDLVFRGFEGVYDQKLRSYWFSPRIGLARRKGEIALTESFSFQMNCFDPVSLRWTTHTFPSSAEPIDAIWEKQRLTPEDEKTVRTQSHRANYLLALDQGFFLQEIFLREQLHRYSLFVPEKNTLFQLGKDWRGGKPPGPWNYLVGATEDHLIAVLEDPDLLASSRDRFPLLKSLDITPSDNPLLLFYRLSSLDER